MRYPEKLLIRLPEGTRDRIAAQQAAEEQLADTQRRVVLAGIDALETEASTNRSTNSKSPSARKPSARISKP